MFMRVIVSLELTYRFTFRRFFLKGNIAYVFVEAAIKYFVLFCVHQHEDLTRFAIQGKGPDGKWARKPLAYRESNNVHLRVAGPSEICVNLVFKRIHAAGSYTIRRQFVPFIYCLL